VTEGNVVVTFQDKIQNDRSESYESFSRNDEFEATSMRKEISFDLYGEESFDRHEER
jgi:hypothetical protein